MSVEGFYAREQFAIVAARDEDLGVGADSGLKDGERTRGKFVFFELGDFIFGQFGAGFGEEVSKTFRVSGMFETSPFPGRRVVGYWGAWRVNGRGQRYDGDLLTGRLLTGSLRRPC